MVFEKAISIIYIHLQKIHAIKCNTLLLSRGELSDFSHQVRGYLLISSSSPSMVAWKLSLLEYYSD
jgi:hypothetical protein